ncbi:MAG: hypothetical protein CMA68_00775 [Euryarchaeota archaeon]|jgi:hypothetical protein|nr:hypothetical protein [Euryarchaeota archaeon]
MNAESAALGVAGVMTAVFLVLLLAPSGNVPEAEEWEITTVCLEGHDGLVTHTHVSLSIEIDGEQYPVGPNVGISDSTCQGMRGIHTHDDSGTLHIETPSPMDAPLGAFFQIWGKEFSDSQVIDSMVDENTEIVMYVNGESSDQFGSYSMQDGDIIEIVYRDK